ncbi:MAG: hypothetical protein ACOZIN_03875 [Myxococcota bacterium]
MLSALETSFLLDRRWHLLRGEMEQSKKPALYLLAKVLAEARTPYAIIGGIAVQVHQAEPRTTLDIDVAVLDRSALPRELLQSAGFKMTGQFEHSENWLGPDSTPVQFTDDAQLRDAVGRAEGIPLEDVSLRIIRAGDLLRAKLRAAADSARRKSKRLQDLADAEALVEKEPALQETLTPQERAQLERLFEP